MSLQASHSTTEPPPRWSMPRAMMVVGDNILTRMAEDLLELLAQDGVATTHRMMGLGWTQEQLDRHGQAAARRAAELGTERGIVATDPARELERRPEHVAATARPAAPEAVLRAAMDDAPAIRDRMAQDVLALVNAARLTQTMPSERHLQEMGWGVDQVREHGVSSSLMACASLVAAAETVGRSLASCLATARGHH